MNKMNNVKQLVAEVLNEAADVLTTGKHWNTVKVGITVLGSEHGVSEVIKGAEQAQKALPSAEVIVIGPADSSTTLPVIAVASAEEGHKKMDELLDSGYLHAAVTMHYNFPIGTSTVGLVVTPGTGSRMFIATTTGTSATARVESMVKNTVYGIAAAKAYGVPQPTVGILNIDGSRQVERILKELKANDYDIHFAQSQRTDGGAVMRGNDLLSGSPDVMITDSLTGNLLMKIFSAFTTGGSYEALGYGYGPGIGEGYGRIINIISRASGAPVIAGAIEYAAAMASGHLMSVAAQEINAAKKAGLIETIKQHCPSTAVLATTDDKMPAKKVVSEQIAGIDVLELENAQKLLWQHNVYAETGMGCTGPVILVSPDDLSQSVTILKENRMIC